MLTNNQSTFLNDVLLKNDAAVKFCETLFSISQTWDDLIDKDVDVPEDAINCMMWDGLITLPNNPFYRDNFGTLGPLMQSYIVDWWDSNVLKKGSVQDKCVAYVLRDSLSSIVIHCAYIVGGFDWMTMVSMRVRDALYDESMNDYVEETQGWEAAATVMKNQ